MRFLKVTAVSCNQQGISRQGVPRVEMRINIDMISFISGTTIQIKGGDLFKIGSTWYKDFRVAAGVNIDEI
ncbi:MAG: hypothetical protein Tsb0033_06580 [Winogradskyella sp.]